MSVSVSAVRGRSGVFSPGDELVSIGSKPVDDQLDVLFLTEGEGTASFVIRRRNGRTVRRRLRLSTFRRAGLVFEDLQFIPCRSNCVFCFVDQMPVGLRRSLYFKDDDYRLSFLFGNYITLADIGERELERISALRLSPLYISVHAIDRETREKLFGRPLRRDILDSIGTLARSGITMHTQVVLVPGINDGQTLERTVAGLFGYYPAVQTVAIVPVGLTAHRRGLPPLVAVQPADARSLIRWAELKRDRFREQTGGDSFLHLSDEFYLLAGRTFPQQESYDGYPQLANGVGMCRRFIERTKRDIGRLQQRGFDGARMTIATGVLGGRFLRRHILPLVERGLPRLAIHLVVVRNRLFGAGVGVSGLLSGRDIIRAVRSEGGVRGCLVIPPNVLNCDSLLLDDMKPRDLERELAVRVLVPRATFLEQRIIRACRKG
jgi:putative radical SAM enzyme (TIGR03279 family)